MFSNTTIGLECEENGFITNRNIEDENIINCKNDTEINEKEEQKPYFLFVLLVLKYFVIFHLMNNSPMLGCS